MTIKITPLEVFLMMKLIARAQCLGEAVAPDLILFMGKLAADIRLNYPDVANTIINELLSHLYD